MAEETVISPDGKYRLEISSIDNGKGHWASTRGEVFNVSDGHLIATVDRNYSDFLRAFVTVNNQDYLISGASYMGQTVVNLTTGEVKHDPKHGNHKGQDFCWAVIDLLPDQKTLIVNGCYWACGYEYKFFDFSNPELGWPELPLKKTVNSGEYTTYEYKDGQVVITDNEVYNNILQDYTFELERVLMAMEVTDPEYPEFSAKYYSEDEGAEEVRPYSSVTLQRVGQEMVQVSSWASQRKIERDRLSKIAYDKMNAEWDSYRVSSELLPILIAKYPTASQHWSGSSKYMRDRGDKNNWYFSITIPTTNPKSQWTVSWGTVEGDITLKEWVSGVGDTVRGTYPRTPEGMQQAILRITS